MSPSTPAVLVRRSHVEDHVFVVCPLSDSVGVHRRLHESGGSSPEAAAGNDASQEEAQAGLIAHVSVQLMISEQC